MSNNTNFSELQEAIQAGVKNLNKLKQDRTAINEEMGAIRSGLEARGIPKKALAVAMQYINMDPDVREGFDEAYSLIRDTMGLPVNAQYDMFKEQLEDAA